MIEVKNLTKKYSNNTAVKNISFKVDEGKIYGFLGPNGAGKSTTMNIIAGSLAATDGTVTINGYDIYKEPIKAKQYIGYLPEQPPLYNDMTPLEYLRFVGQAKGLRGDELTHDVESAIELTGLADMKRRLIKNLSKGFRQRVGIAQAILGDPKVIILDEPTVGLDPKQIIEIRELIRSLGRDHTVILSSHILPEISAVCDHVIIISRGQLVADDTLVNLEREYTSKSSIVLHVRADKDTVLSALSSIGDMDCITYEQAAEAGVFKVVIEHPKEMDIREKVYLAFSSLKCVILSMVPVCTTLEDIFLSLTSEDDVIDEDLPDETEEEDGNPEDKDAKDDYTPQFH